MRIPGCAVVLLLGAGACAQSPPVQVPAGAMQSPANTLFNGWKLSPAGQSVSISDMPLKLVLSPDGSTLAAVCGGLHPGLALVDVGRRELRQFVPLPRAWNGVAFSKDGGTIYVTGGNSDKLYFFALNYGRATLKRTVTLDSDAPHTQGGQGASFFSSIAVHPQTGKLYICNESASEIWVVDPDSGKTETSIRTGPHPHTCAFGATPQFLYVSCWGDRSVIAIDTLKNRQALRILVGIRPNDMALAPDGRLFVACAGDNTVHVIQTRSPKAIDEEATEFAPPPEEALEIISTSLYPASPEGSTPDGVAVSPDGKVLFVANADNNAAAVVDISNPRISRVVGFVPSGWYPTAVAANGKTLFIANGKGLSSRPSFPARSTATRHTGGMTYDHTTGILAGSISFIDEPTAAELAAYTKQVRANSPYTPEMLRKAAVPDDSIIPSKVGQDCPIKYILYIIKENRTYDQVFGDMSDAAGQHIGNGDPHLVLFGEDVTPNHHQLARDYVLLDNLYCNGEVSVDGHSWCDAAMVTDFKQRSWIVSYTGHGKLPGNAEMSNPANGFLWDQCQRHGVSFKCYGEGAKQVPSINRGNWPGGRDMDRVNKWIEDLHEAEKTGQLPQFTIMSLGEDHTRGTTPGEHTPQSCVASNDIAMGKIVEAATRSKFWPQMAIFAIEDDAQNGPDHVDAHRTVGLVISPYVKRGVVDSTPYTTTSMVRTMELILGLPPMTQYDAGATPMFNCFQKAPQIVAYNPRVPKVDLAATNFPWSFGARASAAMDFDEYDEAPEDELNRILWAAIKGPNVPYPVPIHGALFTR